MVCVSCKKILVMDLDYVVRSVVTKTVEHTYTLNSKYQSSVVEPELEPKIF